jgi:hypothetical protein
MLGAGTYQGKGAGAAGMGSNYVAPGQPSTARAPFINNPSTPLYSSANANKPSTGVPNFIAMRGLFDYSVGGERVANNNAIQNLFNRAGQINTGYGEQAGYMRQGYGNQMGQLRVNADTNMYDQNVVNQLMGQSAAGYQNLLGQFGLQEAEARNQSGMQRRAAASDAIARGAYGGAGTGQDFTDISSKLANQLGMFGAKREEAGIANRTETINLEKRRNDLTQQGKIYGLQGEQFGIALQQGLAKLNLDNNISVGNLLDQINSRNSANAALATSVIQQAMAAVQYAGIV